MSRTRTFPAALAGLMAFAAMMLLRPQMSAAQQTWIRQPIDGGGVAEDQQLLCHDNEDEAENVLWSACII